MNSSSNSCKLLCWNVWSIMNDVKRSNVLQILEDNDISIACITETWFDTKDGKFTADIRKADYEPFHSYREGKRGGGAAILYKKDLNVKPGEFSSSKYVSLEFSFITLTSNKSKIVIACIYRKQEISCTIFCEEIEKFLESIFDKGDIVILVGDFNLWIDDESNKDAERVVTLMNAYGLSQLIDRPTHRGGHTLDHVYANSFQIELKCEVMEETFDISDHYPIVAELPCTEHQQKKRTITYRNTKNMDVDALKADFLQLFEEITGLGDTNFETSYNRYDSQSREIVEKHTPMITRTIRENQDPPWMDAEFKMNRAKRRKLEKDYRKN